ncbi:MULTISPECIES: MurR/RpiR family transcriptional regulator [Bacillota]|jgi:RpiR family transcriptional regulator, carbohydrate utilization regulator|uniref:MurR/RpiR family transcriptional regulator n=1 Tax=Amedibacillus hominis TaxID=2897776 RepID=A0ABS9R5J1_9FIRM|nr:MULTISPECIES: MurR/RpiR family transcriptional regulator [Bacillota]MCH4284914.1 MurR/RpiR family transcriptional regulator [Amedibacillus hominis]RGB55133.1 MurR/RpiR family transcriptional regulator [Absiella sp. AM22-9]RGB62722.1 MurR/RpiR family transcriptional regulator [Absiella sp. AM10-20]RGB69462.1 MurR/RpiR family transcriptional regulator [Absiella sp. AM09-45]RGB77769.1 MurR/RpiR family transcriptional regulator [Absiella sp. AM09-50]
MLIMEQLRDIEKFSDLEQRVADEILKDPKATLNLTIEDLAKKAYTSTATIVRLCKKLGMSGYGEFKIKLATEINTFVLQTERIMQEMPIRKEETPQDILQIMVNLHYQALTDAFHSMDIEAMNKAVDLLENADIITLYGREESLLIAEDLHLKFKRIGMPCVLEAMHGFQNPTLYRKDQKQVALIFSRYADSPDFKQLFQMLRLHEIPMIVVTANKESVLAKMSEALILFDNDESILKMGSFGSRTSMLYVSDCIYMMLFSRHFEDNKERLKNYYVHMKLK